MQTATNALSEEFSLPGQPAFETNVHILALYGNGGTSPPVVPVITLPSGQSATSPVVTKQLQRTYAHIQRHLPYARVVSYGSTRNQVFVSADGRTTFGLIFLPEPGGFGSAPGQGWIDSYLRHQTIAGQHFQVTGLGLLQSDSGGGGPGVLAEALIGGLGAMIVLALVFRSFMAIIPLLMAVVTIPATFMVVWGLTQFTQVSFIVQFLIALIGLGVAIDYSLLVVMRWREELNAGLENAAAVQRAMETAGVAVVFSGTTVAIGLFALVALPVPFLRSVGYGGMLIPLVSVLVAITLLPAILGSIGPRVDWPKRPPAKEGRGFWMMWGRIVVKYRWVSTGLAVIILAFLLSPLSSIVIGNARADSLAQSGNAHSGLMTLERTGIGAGALAPIEILTRASAGSATVQRLGGIQGIRGGIALSSSHWTRSGTSVVDLLPTADGATTAGQAAVNAVKEAASHMNPKPQVGGYTAQGQDFVTAVYGNFPIMVLIIVIVTFLLLARAFRSVILPLKAVVLNVVSVGAAWGVMTWVWQDGNGSKLIWGIDATGSLTSWVPLMVFAFLFGLSMDYEVFILARVREEYDRLHQTSPAVIQGIGRTGRLVTSAALILFLAFVSLGSGPITDIKVLATGLAVGILLDATVIRSLLVPALVSLFGPWNWWLPKPIATILRVRESEPVTETPSG